MKMISSGILLAIATYFTINTNTIIALTPPLKVVVSGAGGQTGSLVLRQLLSRPKTFISPIGIVRTEESKESLCQPPEEETKQQQLKEGYPQHIHIPIPTESIVVADITRQQQEEEESNNVLPSILQNADALIICTSATPKPIGPVNPTTQRPTMGFPNGMPRLVDWIGQKRQIDAAVQSGVRHVVICSSMGGTDPNNMLNTIGTDPETGVKGDILRWKRKAEMYVIEKSQGSDDLSYTIVHPGGLLNQRGGKRELVVGVDDDVTGGGTTNRSIPRDDVATVLVESLLHDSFRNRSFDLRSKEEGDGSVSRDLSGLLDVLGGRNCDYSLGTVPSDGGDES